MPTVLRIGPNRFFFYSLENQEPPHIHVEAAENVAKYWLTPVSLASNHGFRSHEVTAIRRIVEQNEQLFLEAWHEHFGN
jgi:hypothetical protein